MYRIVVVYIHGARMTGFMIDIYTRAAAAAVDVDMDGGRPSNASVIVGNGTIITAVLAVVIYRKCEGQVSHRYGKSGQDRLKKKMLSCQFSAVFCIFVFSRWLFFEV